MWSLGIEEGELMETYTHLLPRAKMTHCHADLALLETFLHSWQQGTRSCRLQEGRWASGTSFSHSFCEDAEQIGGRGSGFPVWLVARTEHIPQKWWRPVVAQETVLRSVFNQVHWVCTALHAVHYCHFPHRWLYFSVPLTHLTPPGSGQCQPSASTVPNVVSSGAEHAHYAIVFNLSSVGYHSA